MAAKPLSAAIVTSMQVLARSKSGATMLRRHRNNQAERDSAGVPGPQSDRQTAERMRAAHPIASPADERPRSGTVASPRSPRRREPAPEDQAMYSCECGFVFQAAVSTSVGCPHCGGSQAW